MLRWQVNPDVVASGGYIDGDGRAWLGGGWTAASQVGAPHAGDKYLATMAALVGGTVKRYPKGNCEAVSSKGGGIDVDRLLDHRESWKQALGSLIDAVGEAGEN